ncbi:MAG: PAS-domain containing protein, partial [Pseudomonadota bacterium]
MDDKLREAEVRLKTADDMIQNREWEQETMRGLIAEAPIIAWHRTAEGKVNWSDGEIRSRTGAVSAEQAVDLIVARTKLNRQPVLAGMPQKSRIEIVVNDGAETVSLHVLEIIRTDGTRIGLATDAGTAASAERTLTRFVQTMTETFAHLTVGLAIFDRNQTLALFNPALVQMWQVEPAWLARRPSLRDIIDELRATRRLPELQDFHKWRSRLVNLFENTEAADYEELWHLADGSNIRVLARPHPHGSLAFIFDDVTERMRLEQRYRHSIDLRRATLDGLNEGIAVFGANGLLQFVNQSFHEIWGTDSESVYAAMHARQLLSFCEDLTLESEIWHRLHSFITGEQSRRAWTARLLMRSGRVLTARFAPMPDGSTMAVFTDITDAERIAVALRRSHDNNEMAEAARAAILHRSRNEMNGALNQLSKQLSDAGGEASSNAALQDMRDTLDQQIDRLKIAAEEISGLAEAAMSVDDSVEGAAGAEIFDVSDMLVHTQRLLDHTAKEAGVTVRIDAEHASATVVADRAKVQIIAYGLLSGACENGRPGAEVVLTGKADDQVVDIGVEMSCDEPLVLAESDEDVSTMLSPAVHAAVAETGAALEIEDFDPAHIRLRCRVPRLDAPRASTPPSVVAIGDPAREEDNILPLEQGGERA